MLKLPEVVKDTKGLLTTRWSVGGLKIPNWIYPLVLWVTLIRSISYGVELLLLITNNPIGPMMAFAAVFGIQLWGILMLAGALILILGLIFRLSILVTLGSLISMAVWACFGLVLGFGFIELHTGLRFVVTAFATAVTWFAFFMVQLNTIKQSGGPHA